MEDGISDVANFGFDQEAEEQNQENVGEVGEESKGDKGKEEGGLINHLISNLLSPRAGEARDKERNDLFDVKDEDKKEDTVSGKSGDDSGGGGIINNLISNIFHPVENQESSSGERQKGDEMKKTEEESASVLDNIVSHLTIPLADDAVPATDEASILIHSIVHD